MRTLVLIGHGMVRHRLGEAVTERDTDRAWRVVVLAEEGRPAYDRVAPSSDVYTWDADALTLPEINDDRVELRLAETTAYRDLGCLNRPSMSLSMSGSC